MSCITLFQLFLILILNNAGGNIFNGNIGNVNLRKVNIRPDEINKLLDGLSIPCALKAGMIGNL